MKKPFTLTTAPLAIAGVVLPSLAFAAVSVGDTIGVSDEDIREALTAQGYTIEEIEREAGEIEVEVMLNGQEFEIELDAETGMVVEVELEDDKDDSDDDKDDA